ncbi:hypothetical protein [Endozoicomonas elysicola]|uniref:Uncharacterized protein n=1 Tax=Endozoicomonas elysicola TaxID=305900 RepID=A0A081K834_9GAMM|nr:hypothetical protein [Endozoicomonas elysicola]KEI70310.1 hypothetical protein GV64_05790 [Endozoicomonas elysicola]
MQLLLCEGFSLDAEGRISCSGESATITLEEVRAIPASNGLTKEQADGLISATLLTLVIGFIFALILRQLR